MAIRGHPLEGIEPFLWIAAATTARWLYGEIAGDPMPTTAALVGWGVLAGAACYAARIVIGLGLDLIGRLARKRDK
jgi:hypothetical protein